MQHKKPLSVPQYEKMAAELQVMSDMIRSRPEMDHNFAERLAILTAKCARTKPGRIPKRRPRP